MVPGPTPVPPRVVAAGARPPLYHRTDEFVAMWGETLDRLRRVFQTEHPVLVFTSSGSGAMAAAVANLAGPGDRVLVASCGSFGERWRAIAEDLGIGVRHVDAGYGNRVDPAAVRDALVGDPSIEVVLTTHCETSTGVVNDIPALRDATAGRILVVDAVSSLAVVDLPMDRWDVDVVVGGSQKGLMTPPGLGFAAVGPRALERASRRAAGDFYLSFARTLAGQDQEPPRTAFTPPVTLVAQLHEALGMIEEEGLAATFARHRALGAACRAGVRALGLTLLGPDDAEANVCTAFWPPPGVEARAVTRLLRERFAVQVAGGQGKLQGKVARFGHCGWFSYKDILVGIGALEQVLDELGVDVELGSGLTAAQGVFAARLRPR